VTQERWGLLSLALQLASFALMIQPVLLPLPGRRRQQPPRLSWLCWALEYQVMYWATRACGARGSLWIVLAEVIGTSAMFALSVPWGTGSVLPVRLSFRPPRATVADWPDLLTIAGTAAGLAGWLAVSDPAPGIACTTAVDTIAALPLLRVAWRQPQALSCLGWTVSGLASLAACHSVAPGQPLMLYLYPACGTALDAVIVGTQAAGYRAAWQRAESQASLAAQAAPAATIAAAAPARPPAAARRGRGRHRLTAAGRPGGWSRAARRAARTAAAAVLATWVPGSSLLTASARPDRRTAHGMLPGSPGGPQPGFPHRSFTAWPWPGWRMPGHRNGATSARMNAARR
jgi:hypothetical protein